MTRTKIKIIVFNTKTQLYQKLSYIVNKYTIENNLVKFTDTRTSTPIIHPLEKTEFEILSQGVDNE